MTWDMLESRTQQNGATEINHERQCRHVISKKSIWHDWILRFLIIHSLMHFAILCPQEHSTLHYPAVFGTLPWDPGTNSKNDTMEELWAASRLNRRFLCRLELVELWWPYKSADFGLELQSLLDLQVTSRHFPVEILRRDVCSIL